MFLKILKIIGFLVLLAFLIATLAFTSGKAKNVTCQNIEVKYAENDMIKLSPEEVVKITKSTTKNLLGKKLNELNTDSIELQIEKHAAVLNAEVYTLLAKDNLEYKGILGVKIKHREPLVRIISSSGNYYLDKFAGKIPSSTNYSANVMVITGDFTEDYAKDKLLPLAVYINKNNFWKSQIEQIHVEKNGNILLTPLVGNHLIELGNAENYEVKFRNMKAFYEQVLVHNNWNKYSRISLKYENQVVAKKR